VSALAEYVLALLDLLQAEGRAARRAVSRLVAALALAAVAALFAVGGLGLLLWSMYSVLRPPLGHGGAALVVGLLSLAMACGSALLARQMAR
jgi:hypothetical protein